MTEEGVTIVHGVNLVNSDHRPLQNAMKVNLPRRKLRSKHRNCDETAQVETTEMLKGLEMPELPTGDAIEDMLRDFIPRLKKAQEKSKIVILPHPRQNFSELPQVKFRNLSPGGTISTLTRLPIQNKLRSDANGLKHYFARLSSSGNGNSGNTVEFDTTLWGEVHNKCFALFSLRKSGLDYLS